MFFILKVWDDPQSWTEPITVSITPFWSLVFWWPLSLELLSLGFSSPVTVTTQVPSPKSYQRIQKPQSHMLCLFGVWQSSMVSWTARVKKTSWRYHLQRSTTPYLPMVRSITQQGDLVIMEWQWGTWFILTIITSILPQSYLVCLHQTQPQNSPLKAWKPLRTSGRRTRTATMQRNQSLTA